MSKIKVNEISTLTGTDITIETGKTLTGTASQFKITGGTANQALITDGSGGLSFADMTSPGDVGGPSSSTDDALVRFDGTTGKLVQNSDTTLTDTGLLTSTYVKATQFYLDTNGVFMIFRNGYLSFEGSTDDSFETKLNVVDPTADRTITLPNISGTLPVLAAASATQITSTPEELNILDGVTSTAAELNILDGVTATTTELNYVDGVTGNIQTAIDAKATKAFAIAQAVALG